eukprot:5814870-Prymnesium_polylepis.1
MGWNVKSRRVTSTSSSDHDSSSCPETVQAGGAASARRQAPLGSRAVCCGSRGSPPSRPPRWPPSRPPCG